MCCGLMGRVAGKARKTKNFGRIYVEGKLNEVLKSTGCELKLKQSATVSVDTPRALGCVSEWCPGTPHRRESRVIGIHDLRKRKVNL